MPRPSQLFAMLRAGDARLLVLVPIAIYAGMIVASAAAALAPDTYFCIFWGREIWQYGLPHVDYINELTLGEPWQDQQWLAHLGFYGLFEIGGERALMAMQVLAAVGAFALALWEAARRGCSPNRLMLVGAVLVVALEPFLVLRSQILVEPLFVAVALLLGADTQRPSRRVWLAAPLLLVWANLHGSILVGSALLALAALFHAHARRRVRAAILAAGAMAAPFASPYGLELGGYYASTLGNQTFYHMLTEWQPPQLTTYPAFFAVLAAMGWALCQPAARRPWRGYEVALVPCLMVASLISTRYVLWLLLAACWLLAPVIDRRLGSPSNLLRWNRAYASIALVALAASGTGLALAPSQWIGRWWPEPQVASQIAARVDGPILTETSLANWLMLHEPSLRGRIAADGRLELLRGPQARKVVTGLYVGYGPENEALARRYELVILPTRTHPDLAERFESQSDRWDCERSDEMLLCEPADR